MYFEAERTTDQVVELDGGDTLVDSGDNFLRNCSSINVLCIEAITESRDPGCDLVELHAFLASIWQWQLVSLLTLTGGRL